MMKKVIVSVVAVVAMSTASFSGNEMDGAYVGLGLAATANGNDSLSIFSQETGQDRTGDIVLQAGYEFNPYVALEGRYSTSVSDGDILTRDSWGIYVKPQYPVTQDANLYALIGYGGLKLDGKSGANVSLDDNGFQWGVGVSYEMSENIALFVDYMSIANNMTASAYPTLGSKDISSNALTIGVTYKF